MQSEELLQHQQTMKQKQQNRLKKHLKQKLRLENFYKKKDEYLPQEENKATYAKKITKEESKIYWNIKAKNLIAKINALNPNPGCWFELQGSRVKVTRAIEVKLNGVIAKTKPSNGLFSNLFQIPSGE